MNIDLHHALWLAAGLFTRSAVHHFYHKLCHHAVHSAGHKIGPIGRLLSKCKWLMDAILISCLACFGAATEHGEKE